VGVAYSHKNGLLEGSSFRRESYYSRKSIIQTSIIQTVKNMTTRISIVNGSNLIGTIYY